MSDRIYESHIFENSYLPFIFHHIRLNSKSARLTNWHINIELLYCVDGAGEVFCDTEYIPFKKGDIVIINSEVLHRIVTDNEIDYYCFILGNEFCKENGINTDMERFCTYIEDTRLSEHFERIISAYSFEDEFKIPKIRYEATGLLICLCENFRNGKSSEKQGSANAERIRRVMLCINERYKEKLTLEDIASRVHINKYYLAHEFKRLTGQTLTEYTNIVRCKEIKRRIKAGTPISVAASECGFDNISYFTRTYKKYMGALPSEHKRKE